MRRGFAIIFVFWYCRDVFPIVLVADMIDKGKKRVVSTAEGLPLAANMKVREYRQEKRAPIEKLCLVTGPFYAMHDSGLGKRKDKSYLSVHIIVYMIVVA